MTDQDPVALRWQERTAFWQEKWRGGGRWFLAWFLAGAFMIGLVDFSLSMKRQSDEQYRQSLHAEQVRAQLQSVLEAHVSALLALNVVYQNFVDINHQDFTQYGNSIKAHLTGFRRLMFLTPSARISRIYPLTPKNRGLLGQDFPEALKPFLMEAQEERELHVSSLNAFSGDTQDVIAILPIFRGPRAHIGYAVGELDLPKIWRSLDVEKLHPTYTFQLIDSNQQPLFPNRPKVLAKATQTRFAVGEHRWTLLVVPKPKSWAQEMMPHWITWGLGLVILTLLMTLWMLEERNRQVLDEERRKFEVVFHASPDAMVVLDDRLEITLANPQVGAWLQQDVKNLSGSSFFNHFQCRCPHLAQCQELKYLLCTSEQFQGDLPETLEADVLGPSHPSRVVRLNASKLPQIGESLGRSSGFICVLGDISEQKELEKARESYVATLTHDLKTPLIAQDLVLENLLSGQTGPISDTQNSLLQGARASVRDLIAMVESTLLYYQLESQSITPHKHLLSLELVLQEVIEALVPLAAKRDVSILVSPALETVPVIGDELLLKRLFHNLLSNAIRYAKKSTPIRVLIEPAGKASARISILNTGKGIAPEELPLIFDKYHSFSRKFKHIGSGLGLYIARRIVGLHHGQIWAESVPDVETRFHVELPRVVPPVTLSGESSAPASSAPMVY